jgi:hypothetical protein
VKTQAEEAACRGARATKVGAKRAWSSIAEGAHFSPRVHAPIALCAGDLGANPPVDVTMWANEACGSVDSLSAAKIEMLLQRVRASDAASAAASVAASAAAAASATSPAPRVDEETAGSALDIPG